MPELLFAAAALGLAGFAKGLVGLGLPPIAMGLLVLIMSPVEAAATMVVPALVTNLWQALNGPALKALLARFWPMLLLTGAGTLAFAGALTANADIAIAVLGVLLIIYGAYSLASPALTLSRTSERWIGPVCGLITGIVTAFTGVSSMPSVPFLQSVGLDRDAFVQAMGLSFSMSALALIAALGLSGSLGAVSSATVIVVTLCALLAMAAGARLRRRLNPASFRALFLCGLVLLGAYLVVV